MSKPLRAIDRATLISLVQLRAQAHKVIRLNASENDTDTLDFGYALAQAGSDGSIQFWGMSCREVWPAELRLILSPAPNR
jgi:hypothetical protein